MKKLLSLLLIPACCFAVPAGESITINAKSVIVYSSEDGTGGKFAAEELRNILEKILGTSLRMIPSDHPEAQTVPKRILCGRSAIVRALLGDQTMDSLREEESLVTGNGEDLILTGGGDLGPQYAVFDFLEDSAGYRMYADYPGMERFPSAKTIVWNGKETRKRPAFTGYRMSYALDLSRPLLAKFMYRNRNNGQFKYRKGASWYDPEYRPRFFRVMGGQHGLFLFLPPYDLNLTSFLGVKWEGMFRKHPEYFSMDASGKRVDHAQLCFSNPDCRRLFRERFREVVGKNGKGIYMIGSNDNHNSRYCCCPGCRKLMEKYGTNGGPLWDFIVELCRDIKRDLPDVFVTSLAYKGPEQTEKAPSNLIFPDNFICDAAFLNADRTIAEIPVSPNGYNRLENLKKWCRITSHVAYWYYGGQTPVTWMERMQKELQELHRAGVRSVGSCGLGGGIEFGDIAQYLYYRLLLDPYLDETAVIREMAGFKYGAAAEMILEYLSDLARIRKESLVLPGKLGADDTYEKVFWVQGKDLVRWQRMFDRMEKLVQKNPVHLRNVRIARLGVDIWSILFPWKIKEADPDFPYDGKRFLERGLSACTAAEKAGMVRKERNSARRVLETMNLYANLKGDTLPDRLKPYPREKIYRYLPVLPPHFFSKRAPLFPDDNAVAGFAMSAEFPKEKEEIREIKVEHFDAVSKRWLLTASIPVKQLTPGTYSLIRLGETTISANTRLVLGGFWGTSLDINGLNRYYDPSYQARRFELWASLKLEGRRLFCDQLFVVCLDTQNSGNR